MRTSSARGISERRPPILLVLALILGIVVAACGGGAADELDRPTGAASVLGGGYPRYQDEAAGFSVILGTPDVSVGTHRVAFVLSDAQGLVRLPVVRVSSFAPDEDDEPAEETSARFYEFPLGIRGIYVTELSFDRSGNWTLEARVPTPEGTIVGTRFPIEVPETTASPQVGDEAPASVSRTIADVDDIANLSTGGEIDRALYELSIHEAIANGRPTMVVFASPGFCTNALCGPQAEVMSELRARYPDEANYIHVDLFENPVELRGGGLERAVRSPILEDWGLKTDEWTFILDATGRVTHRFEAFVPIEELEPALISVLEN